MSLSFVGRMGTIRFALLPDLLSIGYAKSSTSKREDVPFGDDEHASFAALSLQRRDGLGGSEALSDVESHCGLIVGRYRLDPVADFEGPRMPPLAMFPKVDPERMKRLLERVPVESYKKDTNQLVTSVHSWLVRDDNGLVLLIDTGFGEMKDRPSHPPFHMQRTEWLSKLAELGVKRDDVTHVINTHLHLDHVGWNTMLVDGKWQPTFPRARHIMPRKEIDIAHAGTSAIHELNRRPFADSIVPVIESGLAVFVDPPFDVAPGIKLVACPGHSPGMMVVEISGEIGGVIAGGDPMHHPLQVFAPDANTQFCEDKDESIAARRALLARCADEGWAIAASHSGRDHRRAQRYRQRRTPVYDTPAEIRCCLR